MKVSLTCLRDESHRGNAALLARYNASRADFFDAQAPVFEAIEDTIARTDALGAKPLWEGYETLKGYGKAVEAGASRKISDVRTGRAICQFYAWLAATKSPDLVLEFGAAFGASGMYWLAGLQAAGQGRLFSFEPNAKWCRMARRNFKTISTGFNLVNGTFEDNTYRVPPNVGIALIDAIHTKEFVDAQFALVKKLAAPGALVIFDDIHFSDDMKLCWEEISASDDVAAVWQIGTRVGIVELP